MSNNSNSSNISYNSSSGYETTSDTTNNIDLKGCIINNYNVITMIGKGGYSRVWLAYNISDGKYYALKVQNPEDYDEGKEEIQILKKIPENELYINRLKDYFIESRIVDGETLKFICSVYSLCAGNLDALARKGKYKNGYPEDMVKKMFKQILLGLHTVHYKLDGFHGDIKPDNILLCGINNRDMKYIKMYEDSKFLEVYNKTKHEYCGIKNIKKLNPAIKLKIREKLHSAIISGLEENTEDAYMCPEKHFDNMTIKLTDFGFFCHSSEQFNNSFGTRYYMAPEIILMGDCNEKVDIWALGSMLYELLTGEILFDPHSDEYGSTDMHHLEMIINVCGEFNKNFLISTKYYKKFFKLGKLNKMVYSKDYSPVSLDNIKRKLAEHNINNILIAKLIDSMLQISPKTRPTIKDLLKHPWIIS
jgi:serine/threonine-protein kinase SRPK3